MMARQTLFLVRLPKTCAAALVEPPDRSHIGLRSGSRLLSGLLVAGVLLAVAVGARADNSGIDANSDAISAAPRDDFQSGRLNWRVWCPCQINMKSAPISFPPDEAEAEERILRIPVNEATLGGNVCRYKEGECRSPYGEALADEKDLPETPEQPDLPEPLGPSLVAPPEVDVKTMMAESPHCDDAAWRRVRAAKEENRCIQRQELRFQKEFRLDVRKPVVYALRFRLPSDIGNQSVPIRWVTAQWKHDIDDSYYCEDLGLNCDPEDPDSWGPSPFLAQRFDRGILHVTIQDEFCRCIVASAQAPKESGGATQAWSDGTPLICRDTHPERQGKLCKSKLKVHYGTDPVLSDPLGDWVEMRYRVQAGRGGNASIEVWEGDRFIVRVTGPIGYRMPARDRGQEKVQTKFKVGTYRNYMPFEHVMDLDWVAVTPMITPYGPR